MAIPTSMDDLSIVESLNSPAGPNAIGPDLDNYLRSIQRIIRTTNAKGADIAAAATTNIAAATAEFVDVTGSATITSLGSISAGISRTVRFTGTPTLVNSANIVLPGLSNYNCSAGDILSFRSLGSGAWVCTGILNRPIFTGEFLVVGSIQALRAVDSLTNSAAFVTGYYGVGDGGGGQYYVDVTDTSSADNGGTVIVANDGARWKLIHSGRVSAYQFGAVFDDATDDLAALTALNEAAFNEGFDADYPPAQAYVSGTLPFWSQTKHFGAKDQTVIRGDAANVPVAASRAYLTAGGAVSPTGKMYIEGIGFRGGISTVAGQIGFVLYDYTSTLKDVVVSNCRGGGIKLHHKNDAGTAAGGTLVENIIKDPIIRNCGGILLDLGEDDNAKITDGFCENAILDGDATYCTKHLQLGSAAGWYVDGFHCYGATPSFAVTTKNAFKTRITNWYIESFLDRAVSCTGIQDDLVISGQMNAANAAAGARCVVISRSSLVTTCAVKVDVSIDKGSNADIVSGLWSDIDAGDIQSAIRVYGVQAAAVTRYSGNNTAAIDLIKKTDLVNLSGALADSSLLRTNVGLKYQNLRVANGDNSGRKSGAGAQTHSMPVKISNFGKLSGIVTIRANNNDNGGTDRGTYVGLLYVSAKTNGTDAWTCTLTPILAPTGFAVNPAATATYSGSGDVGTIDITFTMGGADATGVCTVFF